VFDLGLSKIQLGIIAVLVILIPLGFFAGRWHQKGLDTVKWQAAVEASRAAAEKAAGEAIAAAATQVAEAETKASEARAAAEEQGRQAEDAARARDEEIRNAAAKDCPDPTGFGNDELRELRKRYPAGPIALPPIRPRTH